MVCSINSCGLIQVLIFVPGCVSECQFNALASINLNPSMLASDDDMPFLFAATGNSVTLIDPGFSNVPSPLLILTNFISSLSTLYLLSHSVGSTTPIAKHSGQDNSWYSNDVHISTFRRSARSSPFCATI